MNEIWKVIKDDPKAFIKDLIVGIMMFAGLYWLYVLLAIFVP